MFLNKLNGPPIGFTAMDLFVLDKSAILTVNTTIHRVCIHLFVSHCLNKGSPMLMFGINTGNV